MEACSGTGSGLGDSTSRMGIARVGLPQQVEAEDLFDMLQKALDKM